MIKINNLEKWYKSKSGKKHQALKDINLEIGSKGFVVLLGKSGSGKSTLLNILGGLDKFDSGEITIKGKSTIDFKNNQWDSYRNSYVGFIFQNFSIMDNISVSDNVALPLKLQDYNPEEISGLVDEVLDRVDLKEYKDRKPNELSGGQKQRVAIARALVKDPEIILADEPTGNLDSKTGKAILELVKTLSKDKLVIMVTHDESFAYKYGDRIIELKDGEIVNDIINQNDDNNYLENKDIDTEFNFKKLSLNFKNAFKLAVSSIFTKKIKLFFMLILFTAALVFVGMGTNFSHYDSNKTAINTFKNAGIKQVLIKKHEEECYLVNLNNEYCDISGINYPSTDEEYEYFRNNYQSIDISEIQGTFRFNIKKEININYPYVNPYYSNFSKIYHNSNMMVIFENEESVEKHGYEIIIGNNISNNNDLLITDYIAESLVFNQIYGDISIDELIGKEISINLYKFRIAGIVKTDLEKYYSMIDKPGWDWNEGYYDKFSYDLNNYLTIFTTKANYKLMKDNYHYRDYFIGISIFNGDRMVSYFPMELYIGNSTIYDQDVDLLMGNSRLPENDQEIVLSLSTLIEFLNKQNNDQITYEDVINNLDEFLIEVYEIDFIIENLGRNGGNKYNERVVGVYDDIKIDGTSGVIIIYDENFIEHYYKKPPKRNLLVSFGDNNKENVKFLNDLDNIEYPYIYVHDTEYSNLIYDIEELTEIARVACYLLAGVFSVFASVMIFTFISSSITAKKKEIGILRALGARGKDVAKIFIVEGLMITLTSVILASILMSVIIRLINDQIASRFNTDLVLLYNDLLSVLVVIGGGLLVTLLSSLIPIKRITLMKPIDAIKNK